MKKLEKLEITMILVAKPKNKLEKLEISKKSIRKPLAKVEQLGATMIMIGN